MDRHFSDGARFPLYSRAERYADMVVHGLGVAFALIGGTLLLGWVAHRSNGLGTASVAIYCIGLAAMLGSSAAYNLAPPGPAKEMLRRIDHAVIYVMIAGTYTPFAVNLLTPPWGTALCAAVWAAAAVGIWIKLAFPRRLERLGLALYLVTGWMLLPAIGPMVDALPGAVLGLLVGGGIVYSLGVVVHLARRLAFHNALWHAMVLAAAALHYAAVAVAFT